MIPRYSRPEMNNIWTDSGMYDRWMAVELAVCEAWTEKGVIPNEDMELLRAAKYDPEIMAHEFERTKHDINSFIWSITPSLGKEGRWIHLGLTSNDVKDTALALQLRDASKLLLVQIERLMEVLAIRAIEFKDTLQMGRSHGVHAEPITFGLKLALWYEEMGRNKSRMQSALEQISVGKISGAVGTHATVPLDVEEATCAALDLDVAPLSNQIVQRDRHAFFVTTLAIVAASLEKFATEIRSLQRTEVHEVEEFFGENQTGSSAMPHKRNPELSERVCGLARLIRGHAVTALENVALWHERDISHSSAERIILPDACLALDYILDLFTGVVKDMRVFPEKMISNIESTKGLVFSQRLMLALVEKGMSRQDAYRLQQSHAHTTWDEGTDFRELIKSDSIVSNYLNENDLEGIFDYSYYTKHIDAMFERINLI
ncbi:MAG: adenylosuccinate lyase [Dehalococcoidia bacterium]|nr:adenylosuccinate lyase [Dehalococcoidia bacterium]